MPAFIDLTKEKFGRLTVIERVENAKNGGAQWKCRCECGNIVIAQRDNLRSGNTKSCGCLRKENVSKAHTTHGMSEIPEYGTWVTMLQRCHNPKAPNYKDYGGRNITVCYRWLKFESFFEDMGKKPKGRTLERRNNDLGYSKKNCCWATCTEQSRNKRIYKNNKTGVRGTIWDKASGKYKVRISDGNNKRLLIGYFAKLEEAAEARMAAEQKYWR